MVVLATLSAGGGCGGGSGGVPTDDSVPPPSTGQLLYGGEGNRLRRYDVDSIVHPPVVQDVFIASSDDGLATPPCAIVRPHPKALDINGQQCLYPDGRSSACTVGCCTA